MRISARRACPVTSRRHRGVRLAARAAALASADLVGGFIFNNLWLIRNGVPQESCRCFGDALSRLLGHLSTRGALTIDVAMLALVFLVLTFYPDKWFSLRPWPETPALAGNARLKRAVDGSSFRGDLSIDLPGMLP